MSYCTDCIHYKVCGNEGVDNSAMTFCADKQTDGDLISRQAVIDMLNRLIEVERKQGTDVMNYGRERVNAYESILDEIESDYLFPSMPSAEKTAEWRIVGKTTLHYECSKCGGAGDKWDNYCKHCGAKMKGVEE